MFLCPGKEQILFSSKIGITYLVRQCLPKLCRNKTRTCHRKFFLDRNFAKQIWIWNFIYNILPYIETLHKPGNIITFNKYPVYLWYWFFIKRNKKKREGEGKLKYSIKDNYDIKLNFPLPVYYYWLHCILHLVQEFLHI